MTFSIRDLPSDLRNLIFELREHHRETYEHSLRVANSAVDFTNVFNNRTNNNLDPYTFFLTGLFHDIGKREVSSSILDKRGRLTPSEWETIKGHPLYGFSALASLGYLDIAKAVSATHQHQQNPYPSPGVLSQLEVTFFDINRRASPISMLDMLDTTLSGRLNQGSNSFEDAIKDTTKYYCGDPFNFLFLSNPQYS